MLFDLATDPGETKNLALEDSGRDSVPTLYHALMKHSAAGLVAAAGGPAPSYETWIKRVMVTIASPRKATS